MDRHTLSAIVLFAAIFLAATSDSRDLHDEEKEFRATRVTGAVLPAFSREAPPFTFPTLETSYVPEQTRKMEYAEDIPSSDALLPALDVSARSAYGAFIRRRWSEPPKLNAQSALISDVSSGENYFSLRSDSRWPIASITKLMTAVAVDDLMDDNAALVMKEEDFRVGRNAFTAELKVGDAYRVEDARAIMLLTSSNEIAEAFARTVGHDAFVEHMNKRAREWGLQKTYFKDATGIAAANQSTAEELVSFAIHIRDDYPDLFGSTQKQTITVTELGSETRRTFSNLNIFAGEPRFLGGKTGFTPEAGENLISLFSYEQTPFIIVVLGTEDRFGETSQLLDWFIHDFISSN